MNLPDLLHRTGRHTGHRTSHRASRHTSSRDHRVPREHGETPVSILVGLAIGTIVIGSFVLFWLNSRDAASKVVEATGKQAAGLSVLNRITNDAADATRVVKTSPNEVVFESRDTVAGVTTVTRHRYLFKPYNPADPSKGGSIVTETTSGPLSAFPPGETDWGSAGDQRVLADDVVPSPRTDGTLSGGTGRAIFLFYDRSGAPITGDLTDLGGADKTTRVDIAYQALSGASGSQVLTTKATVALGTVGDKDPVVPACPLTYWTRGIPTGVLSWDPTGETTEYHVYRTGPGGSSFTQVATIPFDDSTSSYSFDDPATANATTTFRYVVTAVGPGGESGVTGVTGAPTPQGTCGERVFYPRIATPNTIVKLSPVTPESFDWARFPSYRGSVVDVDFDPVPTAVTYELYRREIDAQTFQPLSNDPGAWQRVRLIPAADVSATAPEFSEPIPFDSAYEYRVVANGPMPEPSLPSRKQPVLAHTAPPSSTTAEPIGRGINQITWDGTPGPTATSIAVYRRDVSGCSLGVSSSWTKVAEIQVDENTWVDYNAPGSTRLEYMVGAYNVGPRGDRSNISVKYASLPSSTDQALQYPADPVTDARGSASGNRNDIGTVSLAAPDRPYRNQVILDPGPDGCASTTDSYLVQYLGSRVGDPIAQYSVPASAGTHDDFTDQSRASRAWYRLVAVNATGASRNGDTDPVACRSAGVPRGCADPAYQFPNEVNQPGWAVSRTERWEPAGAVDDHTPTDGWARDTSPGGDTCQSRLYNVYTEQTVSRLTTTNGNWSYPRPATGRYFIANVGATQQRIANVTAVGTEYRCKRYTYFAYARWFTNVADNGPSGRFCETERSCRWRARMRFTGTASGQSDVTRTVTYDQDVTVTPNESVVLLANTGFARDWTRDTSYDMKPVICNPGGCRDTDTAPPSPPPACSGGAACISAPPFRVYGSEGADFPADRSPASSYLGRNSITFTKVKDAVKYEVYAYPDAVTKTDTAGGRLVASWPDSTGARCPSDALADSGMDVCVADTGSWVVPGSKTFYRVVAVDGSGNRSTLGDGTPGYQAPGTALNLTETQQATGADDVEQVRWDPTQSDIGEAADPNKWCKQGENRSGVAAKDRCSFDITGYQFGTTNVVEAKRSFRYSQGSYTFRPIGGVKTTYRLRVCNYGGCRFDTVVVDIPPRKPLIDARNADWSPEDIVYHYFGNGGSDEKTRNMRISDRSARTFEFGSMTFAWKLACTNCQNGIKEFRVGRVPSLVTQNARFADPFDERMPAGFSPSTFSSVANPSTTDLNTAQRYPNTARRTAAWESTPGAIYRYYVWAVGYNGKATLIETDDTQSVKMLMNPSGPTFEQTGKFCDPTNPGSGFKVGWNVYRWGGSVNDDNTNKDFDSSDRAYPLAIDRVTSFWFAQAVPDAWWNLGEDAAGNSDPYARYAPPPGDRADYPPTVQNPIAAYISHEALRYRSTNPARSGSADNFNNSDQWFLRNPYRNSDGKSIIGPYYDFSERGRGPDRPTEIANAMTGRQARTSVLYPGSGADQVVPWDGSRTYDAAPSKGYAMTVRRQAFMLTDGMRIDVGVDAADIGNIYAGVHGSRIVPTGTTPGTNPIPSTCSSSATGETIDGYRFRYVGDDNNRASGTGISRYVLWDKDNDWWKSPTELGNAYTWDMGPR